MEIGSVATDFEHKSYGEELAACQRYYQQDASIAIRGSNTASPYRQPIYFKGSMRASPTIAISGSGVSNTTIYGSPTNEHFNISNTDATRDMYLTYTASIEL